MNTKEEEMRQMFVQRVKEKETELKEAEREVRRLICLLYLTIPSRFIEILYSIDFTCEEDMGI